MTCQNASEFTAGGEGPAHASVAADTLFQTTWRIRNTGTCTWDSSYRLAFLGGERLNGPRGLPLSETVPPGGEIELSVTLVAPIDARTFHGQWQLFAPDGKPFGVRLPVDIVVPSFAVTELPSAQIVAKIPAGGDRIVLEDGALWSLEGNAVSRIDLGLNQITASIPVGDFPQALATGYGSVWASASGTITRIDPQTDQIRAAIPFDPLSTLNGLAAGAGSIWASNGEQGAVYRIDPNTNQVVATIEVEQWSSQIIALPDAVWVTNTASPILTRIDPNANQVSATIHLDCPTRWLAADATAVWVLCDGTPVLFRIDPLTNRMTARIALNSRSYGLALGSNGVWVTSRSENTLTRIDPATNQVIVVYRVGQAPVGVVASQAELWVAMRGEGSVWRIKL
jgi:YVTN family beta-propeller protein